MKPIDVTRKNSMHIWSAQIKKEIPNNPKYQVDNYVRISSISKSPFIKNFKENWSDEVFQISKIDTNSNPVMYHIRDLNNEQLKGKFYTEELQVIDKPTIFRIQSILSTKGVGEYKQYYVKWHGYTKPTWINASAVE